MEVECPVVEVEGVTSAETPVRSGSPLFLLLAQDCGPPVRSLVGEPAGGGRSEISECSLLVPLTAYSDRGECSARIPAFPGKRGEGSFRLIEMLFITCNKIVRVY